jgi:hypothetical protein
MIEVVINYDKEKNIYKIYEPTTDTIIASSNVSEALVNLSKFLLDSKLIEKDILNSDDITYHIDSYTMREIVENNVALMKRLNTAPSGFTISTQRFGGSSVRPKKKDFNNNKKSYDKGSSSSFSKKYNRFSSCDKFNSARKKFGGSKF